MRVGVFFAYLRPFYPTWDRDLEKELVRQFELPLDRKLRDLSRGMRMKAALASSLTDHPKLILLDEPFTGLDPLVRDELIPGLFDRAKESTIFISSHDLAEGETFAIRVGNLEKGQRRFSEELTSLVDHFREVELTFETPPRLPTAAPKTRLQMRMPAAVVRFIESRFDPEKTSQQIRSVLGEARDWTDSPTGPEVFGKSRLISSTPVSG
jgi:ABC-2 type transport system ATP-binding protein